MATTPHSHTWTISNALDSRVDVLPTTTLITSWYSISERQLPKEVPSETSKVLNILPTQPVTVFNVFDGTMTHGVTSALPLTTRAPSTITASGSTKTISGTTAVATDDSIHAYPADGCWDDPECWYRKTHTEPTPTATNSLVKGYDAESPPSAREFFKASSPYFAIGFTVAAVLVLCMWLASRYYIKKQKKSESSIKSSMESPRERQSVRLASIEARIGSESTQSPIELTRFYNPQRRAYQRAMLRQQELEDQYRQERASTDGWFRRGNSMLRHDEEAEETTAADPKNVDD
ncbi:MAG: hypothetical protein Q9220_003656 [cf. Caloplaca sp. 1 TL-2023]